MEKEEDIEKIKRKLKKKFDEMLNEQSDIPLDEEHTEDKGYRET